jgi:hypothetical protein
MRVKNTQSGIMKYVRIKLALGMSAGIMLANAATTVVPSSDAPGDNLSPSEIFQKARENYASLVSYSDEGMVVATMDGVTNTTTFTIRLARTNFYRIEWGQYNDSSDFTENTGNQAVWFAGAGNYLEMGWGVQWQYNRETALANAAAVSGGAAATIPRLFFDLQSGDELGDSMFSENRQTDEKIGNVDCYVIAGESQGQTNTLWIGKQDFLIHQVRTMISAKAMQAAWAEAAKGSPEIISGLHGFTAIETHTNIVLNIQFSQRDFVPSFPLFQPWDQE